MAKIVSKGRKRWKNGSVMTYSITDDGVLTVSGSLYDGCEVPVKSKAPFHRLVVDCGVESIGSRNFIWMHCLEEVTLPASVKAIGKDAFLGCDNLRRISFSDGLVSIGEQAFMHCGSLTELRLPRTVESIGKAAFMHCANLVRAVFPDGLQRIGSCVFADCVSLRRVRIPAGVKYLEECAFSSCEGLKAVQLTNGLRGIREDAFRSCSSLESIRIPASVRDIGRRAFQGCDKLKDIVLDGDAFGKEVRCTVKGEDGFSYSCTLYNAKTDRAWVSIRPSEKVEGAVIVPAYVEYEGKTYPVTIIERDAFSDMRIKSVVLPDTVVEIENSAFVNCSKLVDVRLGKSLKVIGDSAFESCKPLRALDLPETVIQVGYHAIEDTRLLELQWGVIYLGHVLYGYNGWLPEHSYIEVRKGTTVIADSAFNRKPVYWDKWKNLEGMVLPEGMKRIGDAAFLMCRELKYVNLPRSLEYIGDSAFSGTGVREVSAPWKKPIETGIPPFEDKTVIHVPKGAAETYSKMSGWGDRWKHYEFVEK